MKEFRLKRKIYSSHAETLKSIDSEMGSILADHLQGALPAISLTGHSSLTTAFMNDALPELVFAQQVNGYGQPGDAFLGISTSGNSRNVLYAAITAKAKGLKVIGLTGQSQNHLMDFADVCIRVPEVDTFKVQELHLPVYHCLCMMLEDKFFGE
jgi:D-sedoheptulose 7-phosphate isomerase